MGIPKTWSAAGEWWEPCDFAGAELTGANLSEADLGGANLAKVELRDSDFRNTKWQKMESIKLVNIFGIKDVPQVSWIGHSKKAQSLRNRMPNGRRCLPASELVRIPDLHRSQVAAGGRESRLRRTDRQHKAQRK